MDMPIDRDLTVKQLGTPEIKSPLYNLESFEIKKSYYTEEKDHLRVNSHVDCEEKKDIPSFERAGPRNNIYFDPRFSKAAIVNCGGLCPGMNDVIRALVMELFYWYGVQSVLGIKYGYSGLAANPEYSPIQLNPDVVSNIHQQGGTILGSSRGCPDVDEMIHTLVKMNVNILFCIGGDGTLRGAHEISEHIENLGLNISVIGIPKTIDNDITGVYRSFGFQTAVEEANRVLECAHVEARAAKNGIGLVKLMGRDAGFIASYATRASGLVNCCLIPEMKLDLYGKNGIYEYVRKRLNTKEHALIVIAEGCGQDLLGASDKKDASGNAQYNDIGRYVRFDIGEYFKEKWKTDVSVKYISPSYVIRSVRANSEDSIFCADLARYAVDAAMAGKTDMMIGHWHGEFTNVPLSAIQGLKKRVSKKQRLWMSVLAATGQPATWW